MGRTLSEVIGALPKARRRRVEARYQQLKNEVESLRELRQAAGKANPTARRSERRSALNEDAHDMRTFVFNAAIEPVDKRGLVVSFPDVPEAITQGDDMDNARAMAEETLGLALLTYPARGLPLPKPRAKGREMVPIAVAPDVAAKLAVLEAFAEADISKVDLARRLGKDEKEVRRILDPRHPTKLATLTEALRALGKRLVVAVEKEA